jgi:NSS family neurotransmitter:Na+ symporter
MARNDTADGAPAGRGQWGTRAGFILAAAGSAVGLGNVWKFPYVAGDNGGAVFLVVYLAIVFSVGVSVMLAEFVIGRAGERNPVGAFRRLGGGAWPTAGYIGVAAGIIILSFYSVVAGWTLAYIVKSATGLLAAPDAASYGARFAAFSSEPVEPLLWHALFMAFTVAIVLRGVKRGIEFSCVVLLPMLFVLLAVLAVRTVTLPGAVSGVEFYLAPDFSKLTPGIVLAALGQAFFSLSLGMGAMITYGSYLPHRVNLPGSVLWITGFDTLAAFVAGLVVLPAVFAFSLDPAAGPGLVFITLPAVFAQMPAGEVFAVLFFVLLAIAALTSSVSLLEVGVAYFVDERGMPRRTAAITLGAICFLLGIPASLSQGDWKDVTLFGMGILDLMDYAASNVMLPLGAIAIVAFVGWRMGGRALAEASGNGAHPFAWAAPWRFVCRYVAPIAVAWILIGGLGL